MTIEFERPGPAITAEEVSEFEATLPGTLPEDYRAFLIAQNGGRPVDNWLPPELGGGGFTVAGFLSLGEVENYNSLIWVRDVFADRISGHLLAVASDDGGGQICVALTGDDRGSMWLYDAELETAPEDGQDLDLLVRLTGSFTEFFEALEVAPTLEEMERRVDAVAAGPGSDAG